MDLKDIISDIMDNISDNSDIKGITDSFKKYKQMAQYGSERYRPYVPPIVKPESVEASAEPAVEVSKGATEVIIEEQAIDKNGFGLEGIAQEITPLKLQQAIILSELINKPVCKRKRNGFRRV
ncbi:hypothetical protein [Clostridium manihotivorum]|uniref:Uncharacterized protein n=1 Tax=Clostridium manihotivorum TaxID=2320868 RepID=A0A410DNL5_9CLOT|nr:hypothetical protein [Clostridium manihotivorum]QAA30650.1 hypothetical protein C1I91_02640 [Clostridium manihotivorum]